MVVVVFFGVFVYVFEFRVACFKGAAAGKVGVGVDVNDDGVIVGAEDGDALGDAALDHSAAFVDYHDAGGFEPDAEDRFDGVILTAVIVLDLFFRKIRVAFVSHFMARLVGPDLHDVDFFAGEGSCSYR